METYKRIFTETLNNSLHNSIKKKEEDIKESLKILKNIENEIYTLDKHLDNSFYKENNLMGDIYRIVIQITKQIDNRKIYKLMKDFEIILKSYTFDTTETGNNKFTNFYFNLKINELNRLKTIYEKPNR